MGVKIKLATFTVSGNVDSEFLPTLPVGKMINVFGVMGYKSGRKNSRNQEVIENALLCMIDGKVDLYSMFGLNDMRLRVLNAAGDGFNYEPYKPFGSHDRLNFDQFLADHLLDPANLPSSNRENWILMLGENGQPMDFHKKNV